MTNAVGSWKHRGATSELLFMTECMRRGWTVNMPYGDDCKYDCIVDTPKGIRRVQIKSCHKTDERGRYRANVHHGRTSRQGYTSEDCDVIAVYVSPLNHWWIVPVDQVKTRNLDLAVHHNDCFDAWHHIA